jgi:hypothetical protein
VEKEFIEPLTIEELSAKGEEKMRRLSMTPVDSARKTFSRSNNYSEIDECNSSVMDNSMKHDAVRKYLDQLALNQNRSSTITATPKVRPSAVINTSIGRLLDPDEEDGSEALSASNDKHGSDYVFTSTTSAADRMKAATSEAQHCSEQKDDSHQTATDESNGLIFDLSSSEKRLKVRDSTISVTKADFIEKLETNGDKAYHTPSKPDQEQTSNSKTVFSGCINDVTDLEKGFDSEVTPNKESHVAKMARLKREEKNRVVRKSSPIPPKGNTVLLSGAQTNSSQNLLVTPEIQQPYLSQIDPSAIKTPESAMSKLARQKRISKRLTR